MVYGLVPAMQLFTGGFFCQCRTAEDSPQFVDHFIRLLDLGILRDGIFNKIPVGRSTLLDFSILYLLCTRNYLVKIGLTCNLPWEANRRSCITDT